METFEPGVYVVGTVVECERKPYSFNGNNGVSFFLYVRTGSLRDGAQKIKVKPEQFGAFAEGQNVTLPVQVYARTSDFGGPARLEYVVRADYLPTQASHAYRAEDSLTV